MKLGEIIVSIKRVKKVHYTIPVLCTWLPVQSHRPLSYRVRATQPRATLHINIVLRFSPKQSHFSPPEHSRKSLTWGYQIDRLGKKFKKICITKMTHTHWLDSAT
ncbi:hypothetical protein NQD34_002195 [Periophthalmus magnuspinnatus]|nr:hypothetical protein NQD34_002195 [Periophthalmus magnuspinnatus]